MADVNHGGDYLQRMSMVRNTMKALDIAHLADRRVGRADAESGSGTNQRGLSGGERKRVSVAMETVNMPRVLFLDEPTSGLDATAAANLVAYLRALAKRGVLVVMSIH
jgi:ABC-type multidrug transport system ATPase subunit